MTTDGTVVGEHEGIEGFTVGQRKGLGVALGDRKFVVRIEPESRRVVIGDRDELDRRELTARELQLARSPIAKTSIEPQRCFAQIRYNAAGPAGHDDAARRNDVCTSSSTSRSSPSRRARRLSVTTRKTIERVLGGGGLNESRELRVEDVRGRGRSTSDILTLDS